ncbi:DUF4177 domain-containing protein [[Mycoplasma] testudinis]|uniref:DUF4177 domain-containing protein n=1 Tax=[Mycoplasma] testudinis TaxID=33924 RepID=UPI000566F8A8|nr:DUF4177 domain-containing protein [[Mycoplasma] testudinis]
MYDYHTEIFSGKEKTNPDERINELAKDGWRVVTATTIFSGGKSFLAGAPITDLAIIFERKIN